MSITAGCRCWEASARALERAAANSSRGCGEVQAQLNAAGDDEAMMMDEDYLLAMEHGMPPMSGWGMGVDRIVALLSGAENLRDVVLFPLMKPEEGTSVEDAIREIGEETPAIEGADS